MKLLISLIATLFLIAGCEDNSDTPPENGETTPSDETSTVIVDFPLVTQYDCVQNEVESIYEIRRSDNLECQTETDGTCCGLVLVEGENRTLVSKEILSLNQCNGIFQISGIISGAHLADDHKDKAGSACTLATNSEEEESDPSSAQQTTP